MTGATSFYDLETFQGFQYASFQIAALARGHLQNDYYLEDTMEEANFQMTSHYSRKLFGIPLATFQPADTRGVSLTLPSKFFPPTELL